MNDLFDLAQLDTTHVGPVSQNSHDCQKSAIPIQLQRLSARIAHTAGSARAKQMLQTKRNHIVVL